MNIPMPSSEPGKKKKVFVLDTNVILHDASCIYQFGEHDVVIPITVIEELDKFKKGKDTLNCNAREFLRALDSLTGDTIFNGGVSIGPENGKISVSLGRPFHGKLQSSFPSDKPDHHILNSAFHVAAENSFETTILVTKDVNLRMKAKSIGLLAEDYRTDQVKDLSELYKGRRILENLPENMIDLLYSPPHEIESTGIELESGLLPNEFLIMPGHPSIVAYRFTASGESCGQGGACTL